jgi:hypothetical protein
MQERHHMNRTARLILVAALLIGSSCGAYATSRPLSQEPADLRAGQKVRVDDGTCPAGQVKEVMGSAVRLNNGAVIVKRVRNCVRR